MKFNSISSVLAVGLLAGATLIGCDDKGGSNDSGVTDGTDGSDGTDGTIVEDVFVFATDAASAYTRVDRVGAPAVNTALISSKDDYNAANPSDDLAFTFAGEILANLAALHAGLDTNIMAFGLTPCTVLGDGTGTCAQQGIPVIIPDTLKIDMDGTAGFPNGRGLADQVMDLTLAVILLDLSEHPLDYLATIPLNPPANDVAFDSSFPYLAPAH